MEPRRVAVAFEFSGTAPSAVNYYLYVHRDADNARNALRKVRAQQSRAELEESRSILQYEYSAE